MRAVRLVLTSEHNHSSRWAATQSVASKIGCTPETLRTWVKKIEINAGTKPGVTTDQHQRTGTLWEGRYKATLIDTERYLLTCYRYIKLNPVRAESMVDHPSQYTWSSYHYNALGDTDELVKPHGEYRRLGRTALARQQAYRALFKTHIGEKTLAEIRDSANKAWVLGSTYFKEQIEQKLDRRTTPAMRGGDRKSASY